MGKNLNQLENKKILSEGFYNSEKIIENKNHFLLELCIPSSNKQIGLHLNEDLLFTLKNKTLSIIKYNNTILFSKKIETEENNYLYIKYDNNVFSFGYKEQVEWLDYTYVDYSKKYTYGIFGQKNSVYNSLKLKVAKPEGWAPHENHEFSIDSLYIDKDPITYSFNPEDGLTNYCIQFDTTEDIYITIGSNEQEFIRGGAKKHVYFDINNGSAITFEPIKPTFIKNINIYSINEDKYTEIDIPLSGADTNKPLAVGFDCRVTPKNENESKEVVLLKGYSVLEQEKEDLFNIIFKQTVDTNNKSVYQEKDENGNQQVFEPDSKYQGQKDGSLIGNATYYVPNTTEIILNTKDYSGKFRSISADLTNYYDIFNSNKYLKFFINFKEKNTLLNIEVYDSFDMNNLIEENGLYKKALTLKEYSYLSSLTNKILRINNQDYNIDVSNEKGFYLVSAINIPEGIAIIPESKEEIVVDINQSIIYNSDTIIKIGDLQNSTNIADIIIDNLFILNQDDNNDIFKMRTDDIINKSLLYLKFDEINMLYTKCIALNNIDPLKPICLKALTEDGEVIYQEVFSKEKTNSVVQKKTVVVTEENNKFFIGNNILWADVKDINKIDYYYENGYIIFLNTEEAFKTEIRYVEDYTYCCNYENGLLFITVVNPRIGLEISYSNMNTAETTYLNMNLNPFYSSNNNGFIYITDTNRLEYIQFISEKTILATDGDDEILVEIQLFGENHSVVNDFSLKLNYTENEYFDVELYDDEKYITEENQASKKIMRIKSKKAIPKQDSQHSIQLIDTKTGMNNSFTVYIKKSEEL